MSIGLPKGYRVSFVEQIEGGPRIVLTDGERVVATYPACIPPWLLDRIRMDACRHEREMSP